MISNKETIESVLLQRVQAAIQDRIKEVADGEFTKAKENIEKRRAEIITGCLLETEKILSFERCGIELRIFIKDKAEPHAS